MSKSFSASQYESSYRPHKLGNWETPDLGKVVKAGASAASGKAGKTAEGRTIPIVDERGHIVKGAKKAAAFITQPPVWQHAKARWPQPNPTIKSTAAATMGYKGIQTDYLPSSTVPLKTVEIEGRKDFNYH